MPVRLRFFLPSRRVNEVRSDCRSRPRLTATAAKPCQQCPIIDPILFMDEHRVARFVVKEAQNRADGVFAEGTAENRPLCSLNQTKL